MLDTETYIPVPAPLSIFPKSTPDGQCPPELSPLPEEMLQLFEELTGWVVAFHESPASYQNRQLPSMIPQTAEGEYQIIDMSAHWPPQKPTAHREKCDRLIDCVNGLVGELLKTKRELAKTQSLLESYEPGSVEDDDAVLSDSFIPRHQQIESQPDEDSELVVDQSENRVASNEQTVSDDATVSDQKASIDSLAIANRGGGNKTQAAAVDPPFDGWHFNGHAGFVSGRYIDWKLASDENILLIAGKVETPGDATESESILKIDPLTKEYFLSGDSQAEFLIYDQKNGCLSVVELSNQFRQLKSSQFLIATTSWLTDEITSRLWGIENLDAAELCERMSNLTGPEDHFLVLSHSACVKPFPISSVPVAGSIYPSPTFSNV
jgi:hypothetical protein